MEEDRFVEGESLLLISSGLEKVHPDCKGQASLAWNPSKFLFPSRLASTELAQIAVRSIKVIKLALKIIVRPIMAQKQVIQVEVEADAGSSSFSSGCKFLVTVLKHSF